MDTKQFSQQQRNQNKISMSFKVITGTAKELETEMNSLANTFYISVVGVSSTGDSTTVILQITGSR